MQQFHLKDNNAVSELVKNSDVVINLIGQDYETRWNFHILIFRYDSFYHINFY